MWNLFPNVVDFFFTFCFSSNGYEPFEIDGRKKLRFDKMLLAKTDKNLELEKVLVEEEDGGIWM